jgi:phage-related protein (TIGR01555 family)
MGLFDKILTKINNSNTRKDSWQNSFTNMGTTQSRSAYTRYHSYRTLSQTQLSDMYTNDGIAQKILNLLPNDALNDGLICEDELSEELKRLSFKQKVIEACILSRLYGGAILVAFVDDGQNLNEPLNYKKIKMLHRLEVYDRHRINWDMNSLDEDIYSINYGKPLIATINNGQGLSFNIHSSRFFIFKNNSVSLQTHQFNNYYWGESCLLPVYEAIRNYGTASSISVEILQDFIQPVIGSKGLLEAIEHGNADLIYERMNMFDRTRSVANAAFIDAEGETYEKHPSNISGLPDLWDRFGEALSASSGIPLSKLFGRSAKGLNANTDNDLTNWNKLVEAYRSDVITPAIDFLMKIIENQKMWLDDVPESFDWSFHCLESKTDEEKSKVYLTNTQADSMLLDRGAVDAVYLFKQRFKNGEYQPNLVIDIEDMEKEVGNISEEEKLLMDEIEQEEKTQSAKEDRNDSKESSLVKDLNAQLYSKIMEQLNE